MGIDFKDVGLLSASIEVIGESHHGETSRPTYSRLTTVDDEDIGLQYLVFGTAAEILGGLKRPRQHGPS